MMDERKNEQVIQAEFPSYPYEKQNEAYGTFLPFIFVSYCHENYDLVLPFLGLMNQRKYRFWFDNGLHGGDPWKEKVFAAIDAAEIVVLLLSKSYLSDSHYVCKEEMDHAFEHGKQIIPLRLEEIDIGNEKLKELIEKIQLSKVIYRDSSELSQCLEDEEFFTKCGKCRHFDGITEEELRKYYKERRKEERFSEFDEGGVYPLDFIQLYATVKIGRREESVGIFDAIRNWLTNDDTILKHDTHDILILRGEHAFGSTSLGLALEQSYARELMHECAGDVKGMEASEHRIIYQNVSGRSFWEESIFNLEEVEEKTLLSEAFGLGVVYLDGIDNMLDHTLTRYDALKALINRLLLLKETYQSVAKIIIATSADYGSDADLEDDLKKDIIYKGRKKICRVLSINQLDIKSIDQVIDGSLDEDYVIRGCLKDLHKRNQNIRELISSPFIFSIIRQFLVIIRSRVSIDEKLKEIIQNPENICKGILYFIDPDNADDDKYKKLAQEVFIDNRVSSQEEVYSFASRHTEMFKIEKERITFLYRVLYQYYLAKRVVELIEGIELNEDDENNNFQILIKLLSSRELSEVVNSDTEKEIKEKLSSKEFKVIGNRTDVEHIEDLMREDEDNVEEDEVEDEKGIDSTGGTLNWIDSIYKDKKDSEKKELHRCLDYIYLRLQTEIAEQFSKQNLKENFIKNLLRISRSCEYSLSSEKTHFLLKHLLRNRNSGINGINLPFLNFSSEQGMIKISDAELEGIFTEPGCKLELILGPNVRLKKLYLNVSSIENSEFDKTIINEAIFADSSIVKTHFYDSLLNSAYIINTDICSCTFPGSILDRVSFLGKTNINRRTSFEGSSMQRVHFSETSFEDFDANHIRISYKKATTAGLEEYIPSDDS